MKKEIVDYRLLSTNDTDFQEACCEEDPANDNASQMFSWWISTQLMRHFQPYGTPFCDSDDVIYQAMVKYFDNE